MIGADRHGRFKYAEYVRARPFADWLNDRLEFYTRGEYANQTNAMSRLLIDIGWPPTEAGSRRLYRYRYCIVEGSKKGRKGPRRSEWARREVVEDALHMAGVDFYEMFPEFAAERDIALEPEAWCPSCQEHVTPICGVCAWCEWTISEGHMNLPAAA